MAAGNNSATESRLGEIEYVVVEGSDVLTAGDSGTKGV